MAALFVIIVSYNVRELLRECLRSLLRSEGITLEVCVVDNASGDGSAAMVREEFPRLTLIESPLNGGFAYGNNLGLRELDRRWPLLEPGGDQGLAPQYVLLLNPDTVVPPRALAKLVAFLKEHPEAGVVGPKLVRGDGSLDLACRRSFPSPEVSFYRMVGLSRLFPRSRRFGRYNLTFLDPDESAEVDAVAGACMLVRRRAVEEVGPLDERFFLYGEDLDWSLRLKARGWKVYYYPEVTVLHYKGESSRRHSFRATYEFYRAMLLFYHKHYAPQTPFLLGWLIVGAIYLRGSLAYLQALLQGGAVRRVG